MKKFLLLAIVCAGLFTACKKDAPSPAVNDVRGNWISVSYTGGLTGGGISKDNFLEIRDSTFKMWIKNQAKTKDSLVINTSYKLTAHKDADDSTIARLFITLGNGIEQSVTFSGTNMVLNEEAIIADGIAFIYTRTNQPPPSN